MATLSLPRDRAPRLVAKYVYYDAQLKPAMRKLRYEPKSFAMQRAICDRPVTSESLKARNDGWMRKQNGHDWSALLYRWPEVSRALDRGEPIALTEGEKDALAVEEHTELWAASHWQAAGGFTKQQAALFKPYKRAKVYVIADVDDPGAFCALRRESLLLSLGVGLRVVILAPPRPYLDAHDALSAGRSLSDFRRPNRRRLERAAARHEAERRAGKRYG